MRKTDIKDLLRRYEDVDVDIYSERGAEECTEQDMISPAEQGFMIGYLSM